MKRIAIYGATALFVLSLTVSCKTVQNTNKTQRGAGIGAAGGAAIGGIIGNNVGKGNTVLGALLGAVVGGAAGGYIGNRMDKQAERIEEEIPGAEVTRVEEGINVTFNEDAGVYFDTNKSEVKGTSANTLERLVGILKEYPDSDVLVEGHTDSAGPDDYNLQLSEQRAQSVTNFLVRNGISPGRLKTQWYGESQPVGDNNTTEGKAKNRRVEMVITANEDLKKEAQEQTKQ